MPQPQVTPLTYSATTQSLKNAAANGPLTDYIEAAINDATAYVLAYVNTALAQANALLADADAEHETIKADIATLQEQIADQLNTDKYAVTRESIVRLMQALRIYNE